jgi:hypothetical protein
MDKLLKWIEEKKESIMGIWYVDYRLLVKAIKSGLFACNPRNISHVIDAMRLVIEWKKLSDQCLTRDSCKGCPYHINFTCSKQSTIDVLTTAANVFDDFLQEQE